jgi:hypothetical protein
MRPPIAADDESMSGGDESDDMDLTDGSSHESDVSEWNEGNFYFELRCLDNTRLRRWMCPHSFGISPRVPLLQGV